MFLASLMVVLQWSIDSWMSFWDFSEETEGYKKVFLILLQLYLVAFLVMFVLSASAQMDVCACCTKDSGGRKKAYKISTIFDPFKFNEHTECIICLEEFSVNELVTALPCDVRHYFHTHCIREWAKNNSTCPLCKAEFTL